MPWHDSWLLLMNVDLMTAPHDAVVCKHETASELGCDLACYVPVRWGWLWSFHGERKNKSYTQTHLPLHKQLSIFLFLLALHRSGSPAQIDKLAVVSYLLIYVSTVYARAGNNLTKVNQNNCPVLILRAVRLVAKAAYTLWCCCFLNFCFLTSLEFFLCLISSLKKNNSFQINLCHSEFSEYVNCVLSNVSIISQSQW